METNQVRYFLALCKEQSFTRAAKRCGVSQPSVSNAIKRLEEELGGDLFHRTKKGAKLSPLGVAIRPYLDQMNECAEGAGLADAAMQAKATRANQCLLWRESGLVNRSNDGRFRSTSKAAGRRRPGYGPRSN